jgi:hypothetical protein
MNMCFDNRQSNDGRSWSVVHSRKLAFVKCDVLLIFLLGYSMARHIPLALFQGRIDSF